MSRRIRLAALAAAVLVSAKPSLAQSIASTPCQVPGVDGEVKCGVFDVRENRADANSRIVRLKVIVVPSRTTRARAGPVHVTASEDRIVNAPLTWPEFAEALHVMTYNAPRSQRVPLLVHRAFEGDYDEFARAAIQSNRQLRSILRFGFLLSITCTEDVARIDPASIERETAHTYLGDSRVREQMAACREWPRGALAPNYGDPVRASVPVFLLSGNVDPVSPAHFAAEAARYLPNSVHVIAAGGHVPRGSCIDAMERAFLDSADPRAVDTACVASMRLPEFIVR